MMLMSLRIHLRVCVHEEEEEEVCGGGVEGEKKRLGRKDKKKNKKERSGKQIHQENNVCSFFSPHLPALPHIHLNRIIICESL